MHLSPSYSYFMVWAETLKVDFQRKKNWNDKIYQFFLESSRFYILLHSMYIFFSPLGSNRQGFCSGHGMGRVVLLIVNILNGMLITAFSVVIHSRFFLPQSLSHIPCLWRNRFTSFVLSSKLKFFNFYPKMTKKIFSTINIFCFV